MSGRVPLDFKDSPPGTVSRREAQKQIDAYDGAVACMDGQLGALWMELERRGLAENTLLIVTSDHGESLGEAGLFGHQSSLRIEQNHVPLLVMAPRRAATIGRVTGAVSIRQIPATVVHARGLDDGGVFRGGSLLAFAAARDGHEKRAAAPVIAELASVPEADIPAFWPVARGGLRSCVGQRWHFIERADGHLELYDLFHDPDEEINLARTPGARGRIARIRGVLRNLAQDQTAHRVTQQVPER